MTDEQFRAELNRVFDKVAGSPSSNLGDRVRGAVAAAPQARSEYWLAAVAAAVIAVLVVGVLLIAGPLRGPIVPVGAPHVTPSPAASPAPTPAKVGAFACVSDSFVFDKPTSAPPVAFITAVSIETLQGYDRITIEFSNGAPNDVAIGTPTSGNAFTLSPSGMEVTLKGDHGMLVAIHGADLHTAYAGPTDIVTGDPTVAEVRRVQDFEGVVQLGLGINGAGCYRAMWMSNPERLVIEVQTPS